MLQLVKKELKLQPWALFGLFLTTLFLIFSISCYSSIQKDYDSARTNLHANGEKKLGSKETLLDYYTSQDINIVKINLAQYQTISHNSKAKQALRWTAHRVIKALQHKDYRQVNRLIYDEIKYNKVYSDIEIWTLLILFWPSQKIQDSRFYLTKIVETKVNATPFVNSNTDILAILSDYFGGGFSTMPEEAIKHTRTIFLIILFSAMILASVMTRERRRQTKQFSQILPKKQIVLTSVRLVLTWVLINLCLISGLALSTLILHLITGLPVGNLKFGMVMVIQHQTIYYSLIHYFATMIFFLNLWLVLFVAVATLLSQLTKSPIVITFVLAVTFFARQFGLLHLIPQSFRTMLPFNYTDFYAMIYRSGEYSNLSNSWLITLFMSWSLICIALVAILNTIRRRHYIAMLDN